MTVKPKGNYKNLCVNYKRLSNQLYYVIGIEADSYRLIDAYGEPTLFEPEVFDIIDESDSIGWVNFYDNDGSRYSYESPMGEPGFFERYFRGDKEAQSVFNVYVAKIQGSEVFQCGTRKKTEHE